MHFSATEILMNRDFKGIWIPREIWLHEKLSLQAKALWAEIDWLHDRDRGGCYADDEYLMDFLSVKASRLQEIMKELRDFKLIEKVSFDGRVRVIRAIHPAIEIVNRPGSSSPENRGAPPRDPGFPSYIGTNVVTKKKKKKIAPRPGIEFDRETQQFVNISESDKADWVKHYSGVDVDRELFQMRQWLLDPANPPRDGNRTFITSWLKKSFENPKKKPQKPKSQETQPDDDQDGRPIIHYDSDIARFRLEQKGEEGLINYLNKVSDPKHLADYLASRRKNES